MTKPNDVPQDVWDAATSGRSNAILSITNWVIGGMTGPDEPHNHALDMIFARAIMAATESERKACAELAMAAIEAGDERHDVWLARYDIAISIASAIRKRGEHHD